MTEDIELIKQMTLDLLEYNKHHESDGRFGDSYKRRVISNTSKGTQQ